MLFDGSSLGDVQTLLQLLKDHFRVLDFLDGDLFVGRVIHIEHSVTATAIAQDERAVTARGTAGAALEAVREFGRVHQRDVVDGRNWNHVLHGLAAAFGDGCDEQTFDDDLFRRA